MTNDVQVRAELRPGKQFGTADVVIKVLEPAIRQVTLYTDNGGRGETGEHRLGLNAVYNSLLGLRHSLAFGAVHSAGSLGLSVSYEAPIVGPAGRRGARVSVSYEGSKVHFVAGSLESVDVDTLVSVLAVKLSWPTIISQQLRTHLSVGLQSHRFDIFFSGTNLVSTSVQKLDLSTTTQYIGANQVVQVTQSLIVGSVKNPSPKPFFEYSGSLTWQRVFTNGSILTCRGVFQLSDGQSLPSSEQFAIGGVSTVRGLPEGARTGDKGYLVSLELSYPFSSRVRGMVFVDHGAAFPHTSDGGSVEGSDYITSLGLGGSMSFTDRISGNLVLGLPIRAEDGPPRVHFVIQTSI